MRTHTEKAIQRHLPRTEMSRAERRQSERETAKKQKTYTLTQAQIDQMKKERLNRFMDKMMDLYEAYEMDYVDLADLDRTIMEETGVTLIKKREGKY